MEKSHLADAQKQRQKRTEHGGKHSDCPVTRARSIEADRLPESFHARTATARQSVRDVRDVCLWHTALCGDTSQ